MLGEWRRRIVGHTMVTHGGSASQGHGHAYGGQLTSVCLAFHTLLSPRTQKNDVINPSVPVHKTRCRKACYRSVVVSSRW